ncbi:hypothetical protein PHET_02020 [Paragonimus heterotremus]|uniref:Uncharacterized protein n=1 Tax=Paragonimus heterotremus TaxID=100268 RepID=A0A8J4TK24_9TREM|nr:hypothetical protein PHET_02020 [Paragonimus heterotremus]
MSVRQENKPSPKDTHKLNEWTHFTDKFDWAQASVVKLRKEQAEHYLQKEWDMVTCCGTQVSANDLKNLLIPPLKLCYDRQNESFKTLPYTSKTTGQDSIKARPKYNSITSTTLEQEPSLAGYKPFVHKAQQSLEYNTQSFKQSTTITLINQPGIIGSQENISLLFGNVTQYELINVVRICRLTYVSIIINQGSFEHLSTMQSGCSQLMRTEIQHIRCNPYTSCTGDEQTKDHLNRQLVQLLPVEADKKSQSDRVITSLHSDRLKISNQSVQGKLNDTTETKLVRPDKVECPMTDNAGVPYVLSKNRKNRPCRSLSALRSKKERSFEVSINKMTERRISETSNSNGPSFKAGSEDQSNRDAKQCGCFGRRRPSRQRRQNLGNAVHHTQPGILEGTITVKRSVYVFADIPNKTDSKSAIPENSTHPSPTHEVPLKIMYAQRENESSFMSDQVPRRTMTALDPAEFISSSHRKYEVQGVRRNMPEVRKASSYSMPMKTYHSEYSTKDVNQNKVHRMDAPQVNMAVKCKCCTGPTKMPIVTNSPQYGVPTGSVDGDPKNQTNAMFTYTYRIILGGRTPDCMCEKSNVIGKDVHVKSNVHELAENSELPGSLTNGVEQRVTASSDNNDHLNSPLSKSSGSDQRIRDSNKQPTNKLVIKHVSNRRVTEQASSVTHPAKDVCGTQSYSGLSSEELKPPSLTESSHKNLSDIGGKTETRTSEKNKHLLTNLEAKKSCQTKTDSASHTEISKSNGSTTQSFDSNQVLLGGIEQLAPSLVQTSPGNRNSDSENQHLQKTVSHVSELMESTKRSSSETKPTAYRQAIENGSATYVLTVSQISRPETLSTPHKTDNPELKNVTKSQISECTQHDIAGLSNTVTSQQSGKEDKHSQHSGGPQSEYMKDGIHVPYQHFYHTHTPDETGISKSLDQSNERAPRSENRLRLWKNAISESEDNSSRSELSTTDVQTTVCSKNSTEIQLKSLKSRDYIEADEQFQISEARKTGETSNKKSSNTSMCTMKLKRNSLCDTQQVTAPSMPESVEDVKRSSMHSSDRPNVIQLFGSPNHTPAHQPTQNSVAEVYEGPDTRKNTPKQTASHSSSVKTSHKQTSEKNYTCTRKTNTKLHVPDVKEEDGRTQSKPYCSSSGSDQSQSAHGSDSTISHSGSLANSQTVMIDKQPSDTSNGFDNSPTKTSLQQSPRTVQQESDGADQRVDESNEITPTCSRSIPEQPERPCDQNSDPKKSTPKQTASHSSSVKTSHKQTSEKNYTCTRKTNTKLHVPDVKEEDGRTQSKPYCSSSGSDQSQSAHGSDSTISHSGSLANSQTVMIDKQPSDTSNGFDNSPTKTSLQQSPRTVQQESDGADQRVDESNEITPTCSRSIPEQPERPCDQNSDPKKSTPKQTASHSSSVKTSHKQTSEKNYTCTRKTNTKLHVPDVKEEDGRTQSKPYCSSSGSDQSQSAHGSDSTISHSGSLANSQTVMIDKQPSDTSNGYDNSPTKTSLQQSPRTVQQESDGADQRVDESNEITPTCSRSISGQPERPCGLRELHNTSVAYKPEECIVRTPREISSLCNNGGMTVSHNPLDSKNDQEAVYERNLKLETPIPNNYGTTDSQQVPFNPTRGDPDHSTQMIEHNGINPEGGKPAANDEECKALQNFSKDSQKMTDNMFTIKPSPRGSATSSIWPRSGQPATLSNLQVDHSADGSARTSITKRFWIKDATDLQRPDAEVWCGSEGLGKLPRTSEQAVNVVARQWPSFLPTSTSPHHQEDKALRNSQHECTGWECPCCGFSIQLKNTCCPSQPSGRTIWTEAACLRYCQCTQAIHADPSQRSGPKINCCSNREMCGAPISSMCEDRRCVLVACNPTNFQCQPIRQCGTSCQPNVRHVIEKRLLHLFSPYARYGHTRRTTLHETLSRLVNPCCHSAASVHQNISSYCCSRKRCHMPWHTGRKF